MAKRFQKIVIKTRKDLNDIILIWENLNYGTNAQEFEDAVRHHTNPTPDDLLKNWLDDYDVNVCPQGRKKILAAAGKVHSWKEYFRKHWDDADGVLSWFDDNASELTNKHRWYLILTDEDGEWLTFNQFLRANSGLKWADWPFAKLKPARRKARR